eukprot:Awhi_evm2s9885
MIFHLKVFVEFLDSRNHGSCISSRSGSSLLLSSTKSVDSTDSNGFPRPLPKLNNLNKRPSSQASGGTLSASPSVASSKSSLSDHCSDDPRSLLSSGSSNDVKYEHTDNISHNKSNLQMRSNLMTQSSSSPNGVNDGNNLKLSKRDTLPNFSSEPASAVYIDPCDVQLQRHSLNPILIANPPPLERPVGPTRQIVSRVTKIPPCDGPLISEPPPMVLPKQSSRSISSPGSLSPSSCCRGSSQGSFNTLDRPLFE